MKDFQNLLKLMVEAGDTAEPVEAPPGSYPGNIEGADDPAHSFEAFKREHDVLLAQLKKDVDEAITLITKVQNKTTDYTRSVRHDTYNPAQFKSPEPVEAPPEVNQANVDAIKNMWALRKNKAAKPTPPATPGGV